MTVRDDAVGEAASWRRRIHAHPELGFCEHRTAAFVIEKLGQFGLDEVHGGIGGTGVVGVLKAGSGARTLGLRADMDALPIQEASDLPYRSLVDNCMHACGHDGHTAMLLAGARALAASRDFDGTIYFVFQPAEEGCGGAEAMLADGLLDRFPMQTVYALHNLPGLPVGRFAVKAGPIMASADQFEATVRGRGFHAAQPNAGIDPIYVASQIVNALQAVVSRGVSPTDAAVVSVTEIRGGNSFNVVPDEVYLRGTMRCISPQTRSLLQGLVKRVVENTAAASGATVDFKLHKGFPPTTNDPACAQQAAEVACAVGEGKDCVQWLESCMMGSEDFSHFLQRRPGCFLFIGNGSGAPLHTTRYDFNDEAIAYGSAFWAALAKACL